MQTSIYKSGRPLEKELSLYGSSKSSFSLFYINKVSWSYDIEVLLDQIKRFITWIHNSIDIPINKPFPSFLPCNQSTCMAMKESKFHTLFLHLNLCTKVTTVKGYLYYDIPTGEVKGPLSFPLVITLSFDRHNILSIKNDWSLRSRVELETSHFGW